MTAKVIQIKPQSMNALETHTKAILDRADLKQEDADDWLLRGGKALIDLKARAKEEGHPWLEVCKRLGRSPRRIQELMEMAKDPKALEKQRKRRRENERKLRKKARHVAHFEDDEGEDEREHLHGPGRHGAVSEEDGEPGDGPLEFWQRSLSNLCGDMLARRALWDRLYPDWKTYECPSHIQTLVGEAATEFAALAAAVAKIRDRK